MIITTGTITTKYILPSLLKADKPSLLGIPYSATSRWQPSAVMQKLVDAGLAKVAARRLDGSITEIYASKLTVADVEAACLTDADRARIARWIARGVR